MMLNQNNAVQFYGRMPHLSHQLPGQHGTQGTLAGAGDLASGLGTTIAQIYMPGAVGSKLVGNLVDKIADVAGQVILVGWPGLGTVLYMVVDFLQWCAEPVARYLEALSEGTVTYLPTVAADAVLQYIEAHKQDVILDAFKDTIYARLKRMTPYPGATAKSMAEGRDAVLVTLMDWVCDQLGVGDTANRVADDLYKEAIKAGATEWQAGAAIGYGVAVGLRERGFPEKFEFQLPIVDSKVKLKFGAGTNTLMLAVPSLATTYLSKLATPVPSDLNDTEKLIQWIEAEHEKKSGEKRRPGGKGGGSALPLLAAVAALFALNR